MERLDHFRGRYERNSFLYKQDKRALPTEKALLRVDWDLEKGSFSTRVMK